VKVPGKDAFPTFFASSPFRDDALEYLKELNPESVVQEKEKKC